MQMVFECVLAIHLHRRLMVVPRVQLLGLAVPQRVWGKWAACLPCQAPPAPLAPKNPYPPPQAVHGPPLV